MSFVELPIERANRLINHGPTVLVTAGAGDKANVMTAAWCMPASHRPPMLAVAIGPTRHTHELIMESGEFAVCVPHQGMLEQLWCCGTKSGRKEDKFSVCNLTAVKGNHIQTPLIDGCLGAIECRLDSHPVAGDHTIFVGKVLSAWVKPEAFTERMKIEEFKTLHHLGGREFCLPGKVVQI